MTAYVALLRAVNVGGRNRVPMPTFRTALEALGYDDVRTYVQSGNAVFTGARASTAKVADAIGGQLRTDVGLELDVVVRTAAELRDAIARNPFPGKESDHKALHIGFMQTKPPKAKVSALVAPKSETGRFVVDGREIYLYRADGIGTSKLTPDFFARLGVPSTMRNWRTVTTLAEMAEG
jgi:uncharacterized protein (DUF1697 family)